MAEQGSEVISAPSNDKSSSSGPSTILDSIPFTITNQKLHGNNYLPWSRAVELLITGRGKKEYLSDKMVVPTETDEKYLV